MILPHYLISNIFNLILKCSNRASFIKYFVQKIVLLSKDINRNVLRKLHVPCIYLDTKVYTSAGDMYCFEMLERLNIGYGVQLYINPTMITSNTKYNYLRNRVVEFNSDSTEISQDDIDNLPNCSVFKINISSYASIGKYLELDFQSVVSRYAESDIMLACYQDFSLDFTKILSNIYTKLIFMDSKFIDNGIKPYTCNRSITATYLYNIKISKEILSNLLDSLVSLEEFQCEISIPKSSLDQIALIISNSKAFQTLKTLMIMPFYQTDAEITWCTLRHILNKPSKLEKLTIDANELVFIYPITLANQIENTTIHSFIFKLNKFDRMSFNILNHWKDPSHLRVLHLCPSTLLGPCNDPGKFNTLDNVSLRFSENAQPNTLLLQLIQSNTMTIKRITLAYKNTLNNVGSTYINSILSSKCLNLTTLEFSDLSVANINLFLDSNYSTVQKLTVINSEGDTSDFSTLVKAISQNRSLTSFSLLGYNSRRLNTLLLSIDYIFNHVFSILSNNHQLTYLNLSLTHNQNFSFSTTKLIRYEQILKLNSTIKQIITGFHDKQGIIDLFNKYQIKTSL
ncbi:hypothetical protein DLAC_02934 [Tieghemostelium lacteum]|uniref:Uncharacterized protein n=1 Tax=Tieghemostelium lacteum TaxID=361077 RepID=A0A152A3V2_TIELA|nr:hypothetical protein DLAC_02934 [Tieghemostelium lacteum]|eukprot:KYR00874.1 hypothetical protein DLAC_02934 [Tieghemostelium lacteum]